MSDTTTTMTVAALCAEIRSDAAYLVRNDLALWTEADFKASMLLPAYARLPLYSADSESNVCVGCGQLQHESLPRHQGDCPVSALQETAKRLGVTL